MLPALFMQNNAGGVNSKKRADAVRTDAGASARDCAPFLWMVLLQRKYREENILRAGT